VNDDRADWREAWALFPGSVAYIWHAGTKAGIVQDSLAACGFELKERIAVREALIEPRWSALLAPRLALPLGVLLGGVLLHSMWNDHRQPRERPPRQG
jgi:hypothetical protein